MSSLFDLVGKVQSDGFGQGLINYFGDNTRLGQGINSFGNIVQKIEGKPESQLIGNPSTIANKSLDIPSSPTKSEAIDKYLNNQKQQPAPNMPVTNQPYIPAGGLQPLPQSIPTGKQSGGGGGGEGLLKILGALL